MKLFGALASLLLALAPAAVESHGTEVRYCITTDLTLRVFVEHWHGDLSGAAEAGTMTLQWASGHQETRIGDGIVNNETPENIYTHGCRTPYSTQVTTCSKTYNDWVYFDFSMTCGVPNSYTLLSGNTYYLTEDCWWLYPATISGTFSCSNPPTSSPAPSDTPTDQPSSHAPSGSPTTGPTLTPTEVPSVSPSLEPSSAFDNDIGPATGGDYLENSWYMEDPDITYYPDGNWYRLNWTVVGWKDAFETNKHINEDFYDTECKADGDHVEYRIDNGIVNYPNTNQANLRPQAYKDPWGNIILDFEILPKVLTAQPEIYTDYGNNTGALNFCVRSSIGYNGTDDQSLHLDQQRDAGYREINFIESLLTIVYDLSSGFQTVTANVKPKDREGQTETETDSYGLTAWICDTATEITETVDGGIYPDFDRKYPGYKLETFEQGAIVPVCIRPDTAAYEEGVVMRDVKDFTWSRGSISQPAMVNFATAQNRLTFHASCDGDDYCILSSILFADFFKTAGIASGTGEARVKFDGTARRRLAEKESRLLQEEEASPFDVNVQLAETEDGPGLLETAGGVSLGFTALASFIALVSAGLLA